MKIWQSNRYIPFFDYKFYYKTFFLKKIARPLGLPAWKKWSSKKRKNYRSKYKRTRNAKAKRARINSNQCFVCRQDFKQGDIITLEHIIPKKILKYKYLFDHETNLALSHEKCNQLKADKIITDISN